MRRIPIKFRDFLKDPNRYRTEIIHVNGLTLSDKLHPRRVPKFVLYPKSYQLIRDLAVWKIKNMSLTKKRNWKTHPMNSLKII